MLADLRRAATATEAVAIAAAAAHGTPRFCDVHCVAALLAPTTLADEHTRFVRFVQDKFGILVDAFSGATLDLMTQSATLQYKTESERQELLGATAGAGTDFDDVADAVLERQRKGSAVAEIRTGGIDGSRLLQDLLHTGAGWEQGCFAGQPCALVLGPAASGKTMLLTYILKNRAGLKIGVIVNVIAAVKNVDALTMRKVI